MALAGDKNGKNGLAYLSLMSDRDIGGYVTINITQNDDIYDNKVD